MDWLRPLLLMFYAPSRAMAEVRDRAPLGQAALVAWLVQSVYTAYTLWPVIGQRAGVVGAFALVRVLMESGRLLLFTAVAFVPVLIFVTNIIERRGSFGLMMRQEYAATAATIFYARSAACLLALPFLAMARASGFEASAIAQTEQLMLDLAQRQNIPAEDVAAQLNPQTLLGNFSWTILLPFFAALILVALRETFRLSWLRTMSVLIAGSLIMVPVSAFVWPLFAGLLGSPLWLVFLFVLLGGYFGELMRTHRAQASFRRNLEAATLNPADASAHYNLGLIHLKRKELEEARQRFERAVEVDPEELDAHFQLGRIARAQNRLPDAIRHFEQVVARDPTHAQHEIWREVGATYVMAGQFADALEALGRFLDKRASDPEGLYLMGRAQFGLGHLREAREWMQRCIEAVKTSPAYKYRTDKRWLNEAQQFLRSQA